MNKILQIIGVIVVSLGGGGLIVFSLSAWLGNIWANRIIEKEKVKLSKELEVYRHDLDKALQKISSMNDRANYISKKQYEKEFDIYQKIWSSLIKLNNDTLFLFQRYEKVPVDKEKYRKYKMDKYIKFRKTFQEFNHLTRIYSPFYKKGIEIMFSEFKKICQEQGTYYDTYIYEKYRDRDDYNWMQELSKEEKIKIKKENPRRIKELENNISSAIRDYLLRLSELE